MYSASWKICHITLIFYFFFILPKICENLSRTGTDTGQGEDWQLLLIDLDFIHTKINDLSRLFSKMF